MRGVSSVGHWQGDSISRMGARRATLALGACAGAALLALSAAPPAQAQPVGYVCAANHKYMPGKNDKPQFDTTDSLKPHELWLEAFAAPRTGPLDATTQSGLRLASSTCENLVAGRNGKKNNIRAQACIGDALSALATVDPTISKNDAFCAYEAVHQLAGRDNKPASKDYDLRALRGQAKLWSAAGYSRKVADTYEAILQLTPPTYDLVLALADAQAVSDMPQALDTYDRLFTIPGQPASFNNESRADIRTKQARIAARTNPADVAKQRDLWIKARDLAPTLLEPNYRLGMIDFAANNPKARDFFEAATRAAPAAQDSPNFRTESHYYLALLDARRAVTSTSGAMSLWQGVRANARTAGVGVPGATRLECVALIAEGTPAEFEFKRGAREEASACAGGGENAEAKLLQGLYYMRRAQFVPEACAALTPTPRPRGCRGDLTQATIDRRELLGLAETAFESGKRLAAGSTQSFDWLQEKKTPAPTIGEYLDAGSLMSIRARDIALGECGLEKNPPRVEVKPLFATLDLLKCQPPGPRRSP
jgi:hypothetical protein